MAVEEHDDHHDEDEADTEAVDAGASAHGDGALSERLDAVEDATEPATA
jgi:hypothetical protein